MILEEAESILAASVSVSPIETEPVDTLDAAIDLASEPAARRRRDANRVSLPFLRVQERKLLLAAVDAMIAASATLIAYDVWRIEAHPAGDNMTTIPWPWVIFATISWVVVSWLAGNYELDVADRFAHAAKRTGIVAAGAAGEGLLFYWLFLKTYPRPALAIALLGATAATLVWRGVYAQALGRTGATRTLLLGDRAAFESLQAVIEENLGRYRLVAHVLPEMVIESDFAAVHDSLQDLIDQRQVHRIVVGPRIQLTDAIVASLIAAIEAGVEVFDFNTAYEEVASKVAVEHLGRQWLASLPTRPRTNNLEEGLMRLFDITGAIVGLAITLVLFVPISVTMLLTSPGPILYSQRRIGRGGRPFTMYKFRSMRTDAEATGMVWADRNDPRVTRLGKILRGTHLDELPQFFNVLRGDMSLVGPRPERPEFTDLLSARIPFYRLRLSVRPGMTGQKQIKFGYAASEEEHLEVLRHDLYYIKHRSFVMNLSIVAQTIGSMVRLEGRY